MTGNESGQNLFLAKSMTFLFLEWAWPVLFLETYKVLPKPGSVNLGSIKVRKSKLRHNSKNVYITGSK